MIRLCCFCALTSLPGMLPALALPARPDAASDARKAIVTAYTRMNDATTHKDAGMLLAYYAPGYRATSHTGETITLSQQSRLMRQVFAEARGIKSQTTLKKFALKNGEAIAVVKSQITLLMPGTQPGKRSLMVIDSVTEDVWAKSGKGWLMKRGREISTSESVDGVPQTHR